MLENAFWSISLIPQRGASIVSCDYLGFPVFEPARLEFETKKDVFASSCFPLIPFSNRIENGRFSFNGKTYQLNPNHPDQKFPIHGNAWEMPWDVIEHSPEYCRLSLTYTPERGGWPWAYQAEQIISLEDDILTFEISLKNISEEPFPAGIGLHPFFANALSAQVEFEANSIWQCDDRLIPTTSMVTTHETGFLTLQPIAGRRLDNCFSDWSGKARISWPEFDHNIEIQAGPIFSNVVTYIQPENSFFCLEPVSHINNALNLGEHSDVAVLKPNAVLSGSISFQSY